MQTFKRLFEPRSIAVVGVSEDTSRPGTQAVHTLRRNGYRGRIFPVNPKYDEFEGVKCYPSIAEIEAELDVVVIGVPAGGVLPIVEECARHNRKRIAELGINPLFALPGGAVAADALIVLKGPLGEEVAEH